MSSHDEGFGQVASITAVFEQSDLGVVLLRVREVEFDRRDDPLAVVPHGLGQLHHGGDASSTAPIESPLEVRPQSVGLSHRKMSRSTSLSRQLR